jgi:dynein heavy chain 1
MLLLSQFKESNTKGSSSDDEIYKAFIRNVQRNLHVVFTMNPNNPDFSNRTASSPALFNRCVIDWFGDWSEEGLIQVAKEFTMVIDPVMESFEVKIEEDEARHQVVIHTIVGIHNTVIELNKRLSKSAKKFNYITPRDFLDFIKHFVELYNEKKSMLEDQQFHLNVGLDKLKQTESQVLEMQGSLDEKKKELEKKEKEASQKMTLIVQEKTKAKEKQEESAKLKVIL